MRGTKNLGCFLIAGFILLAISVSAYGQGFNAWGFGCTCGGEANYYTCSLLYNNDLGENVAVVFLFTNSAGRVVSAPAPTAYPGSGTVEARFYCSAPVQPGTYKVFWKAYRESDTSQSDAAAWSKSNEIQELTCPCEWQDVHFTGTILSITQLIGATVYKVKSEQGDFAGTTVEVGVPVLPCDDGSEKVDPDLQVGDWVEVYGFTGKRYGVESGDAVIVHCAPYYIIKKMIPTSLTITLDPSSISENTDKTIKVSGRLTRSDNGQGVSRKKINILFSDLSKTAFTDRNGYYRVAYKVNLLAGSYKFTANFAGDSEYGPSSNTATLVVSPEYYVAFLVVYCDDFLVVRNSRPECVAFGNLYIAKIGTPGNWVRDMKQKKLRTPGKPEFKHSGNIDVSPNGQWIVFSVFEKLPDGSGNWNIYLGRLNLKNYSIEDIKPIATTESREEDPKFSWDGTEIVFKKDGDIFIYDLKKDKLIEDEELQNLPRDGMNYEDWGPFFSPDGAKIVFTRRTGSGEDSDEIFVYSRQQGTLDRLTNNHWPDRYPVFLRDGRIVFSHKEAKMDDDLYIIDLSNKWELLLYSSKTSDADPYPLRDNRSWLFFINRKGVYNLYSLEFLNLEPLRTKVKQISKGINVLGPVIFSASIPASTPSKPTQMRKGESLLVKEIKLFPNPIGSSSKATLKAEGTGIAGIKVEIFNLAGVKVFEQEAFGSSLGFYPVDNNGHSLANGVYLYVATIKGFNGEIKRSEVKKLIVLK